MAYGLYDGTLNSIPGLGGYLQQTQINRQADAANIQNSAALLQFAQSQKAQQDDANIRAVMANAQNPMDAIPSLVRLGTPGAVAMASNYMKLNQAMATQESLKGLDWKNPDALEAAAPAASMINPTLATTMMAVAKDQRQRQSDMAEHQAQASQATPITNAPATGYQVINGAPVLADRSNIGGAVPAMGNTLANAPMGSISNTPDPTEPPVPPEVRAAMASGRPFVTGFSAAPAPSNTTQQTGGLFSQFYNSPISVIPRTAAADQMAVDNSNPLSISPKTFDTQAATMGTREANLANSQALAGLRNDTAQRGQDIRSDTAAEGRDAAMSRTLLTQGVNIDGTLNDAGEQMAQAIAKGQLAPLSGAALIRPGGRAIMSRVMDINPNFNAQQYGVSFATEKGFTSGKQGNTIKSFNTAIDHLSTLSDLADALGNDSNIQLVNKLGNYIGVQTGQPAPNTFEAAKQIVGDEIVKAIVGAGGGVGDREKAQAAISAAASPQQLKGVIQTYTQLMGGQLHGLYQQYVSGGGKQDFNSFLTSQAQQVANLPGSTTTPQVAAPPAAVMWLKSHPNLRGDFDAKYGVGQAAQVLGQ